MIELIVASLLWNTPNITTVCTKIEYRTPEGTTQTLHGYRSKVVLKYISESGEVTQLDLIPVNSNGEQLYLHCIETIAV